MNKTILSLFDFSGNWSRPYKEKGFDIIQIDKKLNYDILTWDYRNIKNVYGILIAIPCTHFALSGARWFAEKDKDGRTQEAINFARISLEIVDYFKPKFWCLENPMSRIHKLVPELGNIKFKFHPFEFAQYDPNPRDSQYSKMTWLWGKFNNPTKKPLKNLDGTKGWLNLGGKSERTKELRSITPLGFSYAFYEANK